MPEKKQNEQAGDRHIPMPSVEEVQRALGGIEHIDDFSGRRVCSRSCLARR
jgi:hypothetical protein